MKIFYYCHTGVHTALIAGAIHLGLLPQSKVPNREQLFNLKGYGSKKKEDIGHITFLGTDDQGSDVYTLGVLNEKDLCSTSLKGLLKIFDIKEADYLLVDSIKDSNKWVDVGLSLNFLLGPNMIGDRLTLYGLQKNYPRIAEVVEQTKKYQINNSGG